MKASLAGSKFTRGQRKRQHGSSCFYNGLACGYTLADRGYCIRKGRHIHGHATHDNVLVSDRHAYNGIHCMA